jgi:cation diffusion facilitator family transporter
VHRIGEHESWDPFPPNPAVHDRADRADANRAIGISAVGLALTGGIELTFALLSGSVGLLGDALHNLADMSTSLVVFVGFRISKRPASSSHPYGWERAEDVAGLGVALVIWMSALFAGVISIHKLLANGATSHVGFGIAAAAIGIVGNQSVARYKGRAGRRIHSATLLADAQHSWLDALSSAGAMLGLIGVATGARWADAIAGLIVTGFICHVGYEVTSELVDHLTDGVDPAVVARSERAAVEVDGVEHAHVRARWMGRSLLVEVEGFLAPLATIERGDAIGRAVEAAVTAAVPDVRAVLWSPRPLMALYGNPNGDRSDRPPFEG